MWFIIYIPVVSHLPRVKGTTTGSPFAVFTTNTYLGIYFLIPRAGIIFPHSSLSLSIISNIYDLAHRLAAEPFSVDFQLICDKV